MSLTYMESLGTHIQKINIKAQKIDGFTLKAYKIFLAFFFFKDKLE